MANGVFLKVTSAFVVAGQIARKGEVVEVTEVEAKDLLQRGKAELATQDDAPRVAKQPLAVEAAKADEQPQPKPAKRRGK